MWTTTLCAPAARIRKERQTHKTRPGRATRGNNRVIYRMALYVRRRKEQQRQLYLLYVLGLLISVSELCYNEYFINLRTLLLKLYLQSVTPFYRCTEGGAEQRWGGTAATGPAYDLFNSDLLTYSTDNLNNYLPCPKQKRQLITKNGSINRKPVNRFRCPIDLLLPLLHHHNQHSKEPNLKIDIIFFCCLRSES